MKQTYFAGASACLLFLSACGTGGQDDEYRADGTAGEGSEDEAEGQERELQTSDEAEDGDFTYRIWLDEAYYQEYEEILLHAELTYTGDEEEIDITHNPSPFWFPMEERDRGFEVGYYQIDMGGGTTFGPGDSITETFEGPAGGYGETDPESYRTFMEDIHENEGFPKGHYVVNGYAEFTVMEGKQGGDHIRLEGEVEFIVGE
ncbi:hypothetical protein [Alteribacter natronophilus]|uniref:hypothetical protein n=1 Tax=Alteribacter natronophilus TaxID=2583810 RepID=UPI00110D5F56|nr:hypothetical protein [Alteribacter natronophilus]TMW71005.1 hypothetical protein FGB90_13610 [Alteribacter natronophilus]